LYTTGSIIFRALQTNILYAKCFRITPRMQHILRQTAYTGVVKVTMWWV